MNNKNSKKPMDKKSMTVMWVIIAAIMVYAGASDGEAIIPAVSTLAITTVIILAASAANKKTAARQSPKPQAAPVRAARERPAAPDERPRVSKLKNRRGLWLGILLSAIALLAVLPKELLRDTLRLIEHFGLRRALHVLWYSQRGQVYGLMIFAGLALLVVLALSRMSALSRRIRREPENIPVPRSAGVKAPETEDAITCEHHTGREKYLRQLDSYLQAGLIDRAEYRTLKERYEKLDIPEDYH